MTSCVAQLILSTQQVVLEINALIAEYTTARTHNVALWEIRRDTECDEVSPLNYKYNSSFAFFYHLKVLEQREIKCPARKNNTPTGIQFIT